MAWMRRPLAAVGGLGHGLAWAVHGRPLRDADRGRPSRAPSHGKTFVRYRHGRSSRDTAEAVRRRKPVDGGHVRWRFVFVSGAMCKGRSYGVVPTFSRCRATSAATLEAGWFDNSGQMVCWCLCFGLFPTLSLCITQIRGSKFCDGIVNKTSDSAKTTQSSAPSTRRVLSDPWCITRAHEGDHPKPQ